MGRDADDKKHSIEIVRQHNMFYFVPNHLLLVITLAFGQLQNRRAGPAVRISAHRTETAGPCPKKCSSTEREV